MRIFRHLSELAKYHHPFAMAIGVFDGVHVGHQRIIRSCVQRAHSLGGGAIILTFHPHPAKIIRPDSAPPLLTTEQQDYEIFSSFDVDVCLIQDFTTEISRMTAEEFLTKLREAIPTLQAIYVGPDWHFGKGRDGNFETLASWGKSHQVDVPKLEAVKIEGEPVSSTAIRTLILEGKIQPANDRLGRPYQVLGRVIHGEGKGVKIGFPTVNLEVENELLPKNGVYAARALVEGEVLAAAVNIGVRPTVSTSSEIVVEAHLLNCSGDLYGHHLRLDFIDRLREEKKFKDLEELRSNIAIDCLAAFQLAHL
jgi:riboflavin kinase/FMN adenylyltransferase